MFDTTNFKDLSPEEYKAATQAHWGANPCGSDSPTSEYLSREWFEEVEEHRYRTHPWILEAITDFPIRGKDVLEIGFGMGTDHLALARQGARMHGIDLTPRNREIVERRFELYGEHTELVTDDAEALPYPDESFDFVYSFGVVHHSPDTSKIISEIRRVLRPGGRCWITVYHRNSLYFWWTVFLWDWVLMRNFRRETLRQRLSRCEYPGDDPNLVIKLYGKRQFARLFEDFAEVRPTVDHLLTSDIAVLGSRVPEKPLRRLGRHLGWYVVVEAVK